MRHCKTYCLALPEDPWRIDWRTFLDDMRPSAATGVALTMGDEQVTYGALDTQANRVAEFLQVAGITQGDRVAIWDLNSLAFFAILFGAAKLGAVVAPVNYRLAPPEVSQILGDADARVLFVGAPLLDPLDAVELPESLQTVVVLDGPATGDRVGWEDWLSPGPGSDPGFVGDEDTVVAQLYTSGIAARPSRVGIRRARNRAMFSRMRRGWALTKKSWGVVRAHPGIAWLPVYGGLLAALAMLVLAGPGGLLLSQEDGGTVVQVLGGVLVAGGVYLASFAVIYFNVALAAAADQALSGQDPDVAAARQVARSRIGVIAGWAFVSVVVTAILSVIRERGGAAGGIFAAVGGAIWSLVTFLVVPVLAFEGVGPIDATKRSTHLFKQRWGQQITGNVAIGGIAGLVMFLGILVGAGGVFLLVTGGTAAEVGGGALLAVGIVIAIAAAVFSGAVRGVFGVALYHFVTEDAAVGPFTSAELEQTAKVTA